MIILLVDDEELQLLRLENAVKKVLTEGDIRSYTNPAKAFEDNKKQKIDVAFLDIEMPAINGLQLAKKLKSVNPLINIVFVTAYPQYAVNAYELRASGYITKPVTEDKVRLEIDGLRYPIDFSPTKRLYVKCFGNFEVFCDGQPLHFQRSKSKELFAYLIDREGASVSVNELNAVLWEEDHKSYLRVLIADVQSTLKNAGVQDVFIKRFNECYIDPSKIDCDAYEYKHSNPAAIRMYRGEYMIQYPWAIFEEFEEF